MCYQHIQPPCETPGISRRVAVANILPKRKRVHSAPTAPKTETTLAYLFGYEIGLDLRVADCIIEGCCLRDQLDYQAGLSRGQREIMAALEEYKILQARERALLRRIEAAERRRGSQSKTGLHRRSKDYHDFVPDDICRKRNEAVDDSVTSVINSVRRNKRAQA